MKTDDKLLQQNELSELVELYNNAIRYINVIRLMGRGLSMTSDEFIEFHRSMEMLRRQIELITGCYTSLPIDKIDFSATMLNLQTPTKS